MASTNGSFYKNPIFWILLLLIIFIFVPVGIVMADGEAGYALSFDGVDDYVWLGSTDALMGTGWEDTKSVSLWVKPEGVAVTCFMGDPGQCDTIFGDRPVWWGISRGIINGQDRIWVWNNSVGDVTAYDKIGVPYTNGEWLQIALVHTGGMWSVYKNGELVDTIASGTTDQPGPLEADPVLHIGAVIKSADDNWSFEGQIDEVRIYNSALTQTDIRNGLFTELVGDEAGLVAYYPMSDGSGLIVSDDRVLAGGAPVPHPFDGQIRQSEFVSPSVPPPAQWVSSTAFDKPVVPDLVIEIDEDSGAVPIPLIGVDKQGDPLSFAYAEPTNLTLGVLSGEPPNLSYTPNSNAYGTDRFTYTASDETHTSAPGIVEIRIAAVNDQPIAYDATATTIRNTPVTIPLIATDIEDSNLTYQVVQPLQHGGLAQTWPNVTYTPHPGFFGIDQFTYRVRDSENLSSNIATVTITVDVPNEPPVANALVVSTEEDTAAALLLSATDVEGDAITYHLASNPAKGVLSGSPPNLTYTPSLNENGSDSFTYYASDAYHAGPIATVSITIEAVNDAPLAESQILVAQEDTPLPITLSGSDVEGDDLIYVNVGTPAHGVLTGTPPHLTYTPDLNYAGQDQFTFQTNDGGLDSNTATITVNVAAVNDAPIAQSQSVVVTIDTPLLITLTATDIELDSLTYTLLTQPAHGDLVGAGATWSYTSDSGYLGEDQFTFRAADGQLISNTATVSIQVVAVNARPSADDQQLTTEEDTPLSIELIGSDPEGMVLSFRYLQPQFGTVTGTAPNVMYTPNPGFSGEDRFTYFANDGVNDSPAATITITVLPGIPVTSGREIFLPFITR